ncbi:MAG: ABC transporter permease [Anaerolineales bacterium]|nr:ABC transporter permease [Anaerolineales bacterium]NUQ84635.1 ABC transporter permease [Anaerolineales bacterium]
MKKLLLIGLKDLQLMFRDRAALTFMLLAPFLLTIGMGFVTGRFSGGSTGISDIPVVIVNLDQAELGNALEDLFNSEDMAELLEPTASSDPEAARQLIDSDQASAAVIIPQGFTRSIIPAEGTMFDANSVPPEAVQIEVYANPSRPTGAGIVKAIVDEFVSRVEEGRTSGMTSIVGLMQSGLLNPQNAESEARAMFENVDETESTAITLKTDKEGAAATEFDLLAYFAPGMALMFLMYTVSYGGRSILAERAQGTLPRLMISPTQTAQVLGGKVLGIFFMGVAQVGILILASAVFFQVKWGDPLGMIALILAAVFGAAGWGMVITAFARTPAQVGSTGSAIMLIFGILGGSFINLEQLPPFMQTISKITPNAWGLDGFTTLALGGTLKNLTEPITALLIMGAVLFGIAVVLFNRNGLVQK